MVKLKVYYQNHQIAERLRRILLHRPIHQKFRSHFFVRRRRRPLM
jgi:hypothetical protein